MIGHDEPLTADYHEGLLNNNVNARRWKAATVAAGALTVVGAVATYSLMNERAVLQAQLIAQQQRTTQASATPRAPSATRPATILKAGSIATGPVIQTIGTLCTAAGTDMYSSGAPLPCCDGLVQVNAPLGDQIGQFCVSPDMPGDACTVAGLDVHDNSLEAALKCCPGLVEVPTTCRGTDTCMYCQPASMALPEGCTPAGKDVFSNPTGEAQPCCPGLTSSMAPCRGDDMCEFCIPLTYTDGPKAEYGPAKISVDPLTPEAALNKYNEDGMSMIFSDEFKDLGRTKSMFVFEDIPYGVPGNTGDVNIASIYASDTVSLLPEGGMRLSCFMAPEDEKLFMQGWNGTWNSNYGSDVSLWSWHAPKVTSRLNARFQYGLIETRIKAPKGYGPWPAAWLNGCYGFIAEASGEFLLQDDYPFLCGQYWPPELDFFEHFSPEHTWFWRPNSMSLHSPNQYVGTGKTLTAQGGYCPTTLSPPGGAWCFGVSGAGSFRDDPTERFINYAMKWDPDGVDYYMDDVFMHRFTTDQLVMYLSGQLRPVMIPEMPMFLTFNIALVRKGMDLSHGGEGLTDRSNFDPDTGKWKDMAMDIEYVRVYQDDTQGETRGLNPPITYQTRRKLLANKVTCDLVPELRCLVKNAGGTKNEAALRDVACNKLKELGDPYCEFVPKLCSLNNAGNPEGAYGLSNATFANMANQRLSLDYGICCIEEDKTSITGNLLAQDKPVCRSTPLTKLPQWLLDSEYYQDTKLMYAKEGSSDGLAGTNPAGWKTYGMGLPRPSPPPPYEPGMAPSPAPLTPPKPPALPKFPGED